MTPKKTFVMTVTLALVVALGLAVGVLPGAGLMSLRQIVSAQQVYTNLVSIELDDDHNALTPAPSSLELTAGEQVWLNALGTYMFDDTVYMADLLAEGDVLYIVDPDSPVSLGTVEHSSGEVRVLFTANPVITSPLAGTVTASSQLPGLAGELVYSDPLGILVNPVVLTVNFVAPLNGSSLYIGAVGTTDVPLRAETNAPVVTLRVDFTDDDGAVGSDALEPYDAVVALDAAAIGTDVTFLADAFGLDDVSADTDTAVVSITTMPADSDGSGVPDDPFAVDNGTSYATVGDVNVTVADVWPPVDVVTVDGIGIELPADIFDNILDNDGNLIDPGRIGEARIIIRTAPEILDILDPEPAGIPELAELLGHVLDIHMLVEVDGVVVEVHDFNVPITIRIPVSADFAQLFGVATELELDPDTYDVAAVEGAEFAQSSATIDVEGAGDPPDFVLVFEVYEFTTYAPIAAPDAPLIDTVVPNQGSEAGGTQVTISGDYFGSETSIDIEVTIGGAVAEVQTVNNPGEAGSSVVVATGRRMVTADELVNVRLTNVAEGLFDESADAFMYLAEPPLITAIYPSAGPVGSETTISGDFFDTDVQVVFGAVPATVVSMTETEIVVGVPAQASLGVVTVTVVNPSSGRSDTTEFEYVEPIVLDSISPTEGPESGGTLVVIVGTGIPAQEDVAVTFGGVAAAVDNIITTVDDAQAIYTTSPAFAVGVAQPVDVVVAYADTGLADSLPFTYTPVAPIVGNVTPVEGSELGGTAVTITGNYFDTNSTVTFDGLAATNVVVVDDTTITCDTPAHAIGLVDVTVTNPDTGMSSTLAAGYGYVEVICTEPPVIDSVDPSSGSPDGGEDVTILGANFEGVTTVQFGGADAETFEVAPDWTQITAVTPAHDAGTVDVSVTTPCGTATSVGAFEFISPAIPPVIDSIDPTEGVTTGGDEVFIIGANFDTEGWVSVMFGEIAASTFEVNSATEITAVTPAHDAGTVGVTVEQASGTSNVVDFLYIEPDIVLRVADVVGMPGDPMDVVISLENIDDLIASSISLTLLYDTAVLVPVDDMDPWGEGVQISTTGQAAADAGKNAASNVIEVEPGELGQVKVVVAGVNTQPMADGEICILHFTAAEGIDRQRSPLDLTQLSAADPAAEALAVGRVAGEAIIGEQPVIDEIVPATGWIDDQVEITGSGFDATGSAEVYFGTEMATVLVLTPTSITVEVPDQPGGATDGTAVDVTVTNPDENLSATATNGFQYVAAPVIEVTGVDPVEGTELGGTTVTITGNYFPPEGTISVTFGGLAAQVVTVTNYYAAGSEAIVTTPAFPVDQDTAVDVVVADQDTGESDTLVGGYTYLNEATYTISGTVTMADGSNPALVLVTLSGAAAATTNPDANGDYIFVGLAAGNYTITPSLAGYTFTPASQTVPVTNQDVTGVNFTGSLVPTYTISGALTMSDGSSPMLVTITLSGAAAATTNPDANGDYAFAGLAAGDYTVTPSRAGYAFTPASWTVTVTNQNVIVATFTGSLRGLGNRGGWGPCFVATAAYGSPMTDEVATLRQFRDEVLLSNAVGTKLVEMYYTYSPAIADATSQSPVLRTAMRIALVPVVALSKLMLGTSAATKLAALGLLGLAFVAARRRSVRMRSNTQLT